jgi:hypothetical protein
MRSGDGTRAGAPPNSTAEEISFRGWSHSSRLPPPPPRRQACPSGRSRRRWRSDDGRAGAAGQQGRAAVVGRTPAVVAAGAVRADWSGGRPTATGCDRPQSRLPPSPGGRLQGHRAAGPGRHPGTALDVVGAGAAHRLAQWPGPAGCPSGPGCRPARAPRTPSGQEGDPAARAGAGGRGRAHRARWRPAVRQGSRRSAVAPLRLARSDRVPRPVPVRLPDRPAPPAPAGRGRSSSSF